MREVLEYLDDSLSHCTIVPGSQLTLLEYNILSHSKERNRNSLADNHVEEEHPSPPQQQRGEAAPANLDVLPEANTGDDLPLESGVVVE